MPKITLSSDYQHSATSVSNTFIDEYMSDANGEFVKIYLYLLRLMNVPDADFSISSIADKFEHTEKDIKRALCYWERMHLLRLEYDTNQNLTGIRLLDSVPRTMSQPDSPAASGTSESVSAAAVPAGESVSTTVTPARESEPAATVPAKKPYSADDIKNFRQNEAIAELFFITERYLARTLSATDINTILYLYDKLGFSADLIEYLVEYCVSKGHTSIRYIEKVALGWMDSNIRTVEDAKQAASLHSQTYFTVMKALGISGRNLVPSETDFIEKWKSSYGFSNELISAACQRTIQAIHQPSFEYTDSILTNWHNKKIHNLADVAKLDTEYQTQKKNTKSVSSAGAVNTGVSRNKFNNFKQRSYDYDELEKMLLSTTTVQ